MNKLQWNLNRNSYIFIQENVFESVICEMAAILFWIVMNVGKNRNLLGLGWFTEGYNGAYLKYPNTNTALRYFMKYLLV